MNTPQHGGKREGAGRKPTGKKTVTVRVPVEFVSAIEEAKSSGNLNIKTPIQDDKALQIEKELQESKKENELLIGKLAAAMAFSQLSPEHKTKLFEPGNPLLDKLKALSELRVDTGITALSDDELQRELEGRGYWVSKIKREDYSEDYSDTQDKPNNDLTANQMVTIAISQLSRIRDDNVTAIESFNKTAAYIEERIKNIQEPPAKQKAKKRG